MDASVALATVSSENSEVVEVEINDDLAGISAEHLHQKLQKMIDQGR